MGRTVRALLIVVLLALGAPALAARAVASANIVVPVVVSPVQANLAVWVTTIDDGDHAAVTVAFN
jgi:hypothetical protein